MESGRISKCLFGGGYVSFSMHDVPRFLKQDMMVEKYNNVSPYMYCVGNPVRFIDPDGMKVIIWYGVKGNEKCFIFTGFHNKKNLKIPNNQFVKDVISVYLFNIKNGGGEEFLK